MGTKTQEYSKGYSAGVKKGAADKQAEIDLLKAKIDERAERVYIRCLEMALKHCREWSIGGKRIDNAEGYCKLAKVFADESISVLE